MNGQIPLSHSAALIAGLYGLVAITGGIIGYLRADSKASLIAGGISGVLLILAAAGAFLHYRTPSLICAIVIALALLGRFGAALAKKSADMSSVLYLVSLAMIIGAILVILTSFTALLRG